MSALFEVVDPARGAVACRECGAEDKVELDTWLDDVGEVMGYVVCGGCGATGDVRSFPYDVDGAQP